MKKLIIYLLLLVVAAPSYAVSKADADSAYVNEKYNEAAQIYESLLRQGASDALYYNLGNCYYKTNRIALAILNYERAHLLSPGNSDIRLNLDLARSKTVDKITPQSEMFFVTWFKQVVDLATPDSWAVMGITSFVIALLLFMLFLFAHNVMWRKINFFSGVLFMILTVVFNVFAYEQNFYLTTRKGAIVMPSATVVKSTPSALGTDLFVLHSGSRVEITDDSMQNWCEVEVADGKQGWISRKDIEKI